MSIEQQQNKRKEAGVLIAVAAIGLAGLLILQFTRRSNEVVNDEKTLVQSTDNQSVNSAEGTAQSTIQTVPGNILHENDEIELGKPFTYELGNFSSGAVYELDLGDGHRKTFENGKLTHTYTGNATTYTIKLFATYQQHTAELQTLIKKISKRVGKPVQNKNGKPFIDE